MYLAPHSKPYPDTRPPAWPPTNPRRAGSVFPRYAPPRLVGPPRRPTSTTSVISVISVISATTSPSNTRAATPRSGPRTLMWL